MDNARYKNFAENRKASFEFFIEERLEAGLVLEGWEVKTIRNRGLSLDGAFVRVHEGAVYLDNAHITPLDTVAVYTKPDPRRPRKLLLHAHEIAKLVGKVERRGMTLIPLRVYSVKGRMKVEVGLCKGKKLHDKRASVKQKDVSRDVARELSSRN